ncbi:MAG: AAA family ATPase [Bacteroidetes bacterium]|nr:MAG: AAA family ATPase [Bacteroidota bacterium]
MEKNPFKFGSIVNEPYFTNRTKEIEKVISVLNSENHLVLVGPRRYGKSSLVFKVVSELKRPVIALDLQLITGAHDLAAQLLRRIYRVFPFERVRQYVKHFRVIPTISVNPVTNEVDISFQAGSDNPALLEDVLNLLEKLSKKGKRLIVVFDEFQELGKIDARLLNQFRSIMQHHQKVNYVFLGSQESLMREIFEKKKSPFYHFGLLMNLEKIPYREFHDFLSANFKKVINNPNQISENILSVTGCHPYYTQQFAWVIWEKILKDKAARNIHEEAVQELIRTHDMDYERIWMNFNKSDKKMLIGLSFSDLSPLSEMFLREFDLGASSTAFSTLKRLAQSGYVTKITNRYEIDDPFFKIWIRQRRKA